MAESSTQTRGVGGRINIKRQQQARNGALSTSGRLTRGTASLGMGGACPPPHDRQCSCPGRRQRRTSRGSDFAPSLSAPVRARRSKPRYRSDWRWRGNNTRISPISFLPTRIAPRPILLGCPTNLEIGPPLPLGTATGILLHLFEAIQLPAVRLAAKQRLLLRGKCRRPGPLECAGAS